MHGAIVLVEGTRAEVGGFCNLGDEVGFADPGALLVREDDGDGMGGFLKGLDKRVNIGGGLWLELALSIP